ncbi:hypothetical protein AALP_AA8G285500 [Arabis alpina]|uniref:Uncharacterized protein n=1 Tax=Arabis alpina TaxID=50452 RepID=A0A087GA30_ARAAL|nr:hypothetical protein AALP_AA8G285500 [Arabis alpina]
MIASFFSYKLHLWRELAVMTRNIQAQQTGIRRFFLNRRSVSVSIIPLI